jgi:hypothetical protein
MTTVVTAREVATLALVPGVTTAPSIRIVEERHPPGGGAEGSANLPAKSLTVCMVADRHSPDILRLQDIATDVARALLIPMVGEANPDPTHAVLMAEGAEGFKISRRMGTAADNRLPEIKVR